MLQRPLVNNYRAGGRRDSEIATPHAFLNDSPAVSGVKQQQQQKQTERLLLLFLFLIISL